MRIIVWLHMEVCINACHIKYSQLSAKLLESPSHVKQSKNCDTESHCRLGLESAGLSAAET